MFNSKYSNLLTVFLVIIIIGIIALIAFLGYDFYKKYNINKEAEDFMSQYEEQMKNVIVENIVGNNSIENTIIDNPINEIQATNTITNSGSNTGTSTTYKGFNVLGIIEIPKTGIKYPILEKATPKSIQVSVAQLYGPGPNKEGNTTIIGHNYRNGAFFGKNKQLSNGDIIYITDNSGNRLTYKIYNIYTTTPEDSSYLTRETNGKREITLCTCTDDSKSRLIIFASET